jgi:cysteine-rich repeat protein
MRTVVLLTLVCAVPASGLAAPPLAFEGSRRATPARALATAPDGTVLAAVIGGVIRIDPATRAVLRTYALAASDEEAYVASVAAVGGDVLVGVPYSRIGPDDVPAGAAYLLDGATGDVRHVFTSPTPPVPPAGNQFGAAVAALGDDVLVGAPLDRAAYRFDGGTGMLEQTYPDPGPGSEVLGSPFGTTVLGLGDAVVVGAPVDRAVHVFDGATGALRRTIPDPRASSGAYSFGAALAALGSDLLIGGPWFAAGDTEPSVWAFDPETGALLRAFDNPADPLEYTQFGFAIAAADGRVVVGDPGFGVGRVDEDHDPNPSVGIVHVFDAASGMLLQTIPNPTPVDPAEYEDERFGSVLGAVPGRVVVGDPNDFTGSNGPPGSIAVYVDVTGCGDGAVGPFEVCDDGNLDDGDGCDSNCRPTACGNGAVSAGEGCDDGNVDDGDGCDSNCAPTGCGNGVVSPGEQCDDANRTDGDGCSARCTIEVCGNGLLDAGEDCDDGNTVDGDACSAACRREPRDHFTCYRARGAKRSARVLLSDAFGEHAAVLGRPVALCQGDALTAPAAQLTCYRVKLQGRAPRSARRTVAVSDAAGETPLVVRRVRTVCLPSDGSRIFRLAHRFTDPTPPVELDFGTSIAGVGGRVVVGAPNDAGYRGGVHVFDGTTGALQRTLCCGFRFFGIDVAAAGNGQVLVSTVDDNSYLYDVATGLRRRTFVGPGPRTPVADRPIAAVGRYVLSGDPNNHGAGFSFAGAVHVFDRVSGARLRTLYSPEPAAFGHFGEAVAALGDQALIAQGDRVLLYDSTTWTPIRELPYTTLGAEAVAGVGRHVLIGTPWFGQPGAAALVDADTGAVVRALHDDLGTASDLFGSAVDSAAGAFVLGAPGTPRLLPGAGAVHLFDAATGARLHTLLNPDLATPSFGARVAAMGDDVLVSSVGEFFFSTIPGVVHQFRGGPLDPFVCYDARAAAGTFAGGEYWIEDATGGGRTQLGRPVALCNPAGRDGGATAHPDLRLACYAAGAQGAAERQVTVHDAFGTATLTVGKRRTVCLAAP